jgi:aspartate aminotransferase
MSIQDTSDLKDKSIWGTVKAAPGDPILSVNIEYVNDTCPQKVNLSIGAYKDENGNEYILKCVKTALDRYVKNEVNHEYLPMGGHPEFCQNAIKLAYRSDFKYLDRVAGIQTLSGTGALRIGQRFLSDFYPFNKKISFSSPTWGNHLNIARGAGLEIGEYRYYDSKTKDIDFEGMCEDLEKMENHSIVLFHACAHNPTGVDLSHEQWEQILKIIIKKEILPFFDMAYQGFASGDVDEDAFAVRLFANSGINMILAQSFAKNFGLYGERIGCLSILTQSEEEKKAIYSNLLKIIRREYSSPPKFGAMIVNNILSNDELKKEWLEELKKMAKRIKDMRISLKNKLEEVGSKLDWTCIVKQKGIFGYTGLTPEQCDKLRDEYHIYIIRSGRISIPGLNDSNVEYVAKAFHEVTKEK